MDNTHPKPHTNPRQHRPRNGRHPHGESDTPEGEDPALYGEFYEDAEGTGCYLEGDGGDWEGGAEVLRWIGLEKVVLLDDRTG